MKTIGRYPAHPTGDHENVEPLDGLSKLEYFTAHTNIVLDLQDGKWLESVLGRKIDYKNVQEHLEAQIEAYALIRIKAALATIEQLNKTT